MTKKYFPNEKKQYIQNNRTNIFPLSNLWSSFNLDLQSNLGVMRVSPRFRVNTSTTDDADLGCPVAFKWFDSLIWAICDTHIFHNTGLPGSTPFTDDASTGFQTDYTADESDLEIFNGTLCATTTDGLFSKAANGSGTGAWTQRDILTTGSPHMQTYFKKFNRLYYSDVNDVVRSIDSNWSTADPGFDYAISLTPVAGGAGSEERFITCLDSTNASVWIGTISRFDNCVAPGKLVQWDGISAQPTAEFSLNNAMGVMAIAIDPVYDNPFVLDTNGILSSYNGSGFEEVGRFPLPFSRLPYNTGDADNERFVHPNGMYFTKNGTLRILFNNRANGNVGNVVENMPSGVWEWSKDNGLVHVQSVTYNPAASSTVTDWGQNRVARVGALVSMNPPGNLSTSDGAVLAGAQIYTDAANTTSAIFFDNTKDDVQKKGYFVIDWFESKEVADSWNVFWVSLRRFLDATDSFVLKYRFIEEAPISADITWVNTTSFTVLNSAVDVSQYWTSGVGGEVEILRGVGGGLCAHITNAVNVAGTWTVTIDETATGATTTTATARFQKWIKATPAEALTSPRNWAQFPIGGDSQPRIMIKGCFTFTGIGEFYKGILTSNEDITTT